MGLSATEKELIGKILTIAIENKRGVAALALAVTNLTVCLYPMIRRCDAAGCGKAATVRNDVIDMTVCDRCAATIITRALKNLTGDADDSLEPVRVAAAREELWCDIDGAEAVRIIEEHRQLIGAVSEERIQ